MYTRFPRRRHMARVALTAGAVLAFATIGCGRDPAAPAASGTWLTGDTQQQLDTLAAQLGGMDVAMMEIDHRYRELYWAGQDENWAYAAYQLEKIEAALRDGLQRRPARARSAQLFLDSLPRMHAAIESADPAVFATRFALLTTNCNACHVMEDVGYMRVGPPTVRVSSVHGSLSQDTAPPRP
mgnify:CR=1 FL=1